MYTEILAPYYNLQIVEVGVRGGKGEIGSERMILSLNSRYSFFSEKRRFMQ